MYYSSANKIFELKPEGLLVPNLTYATDLNHNKGRCYEDDVITWAAQNYFSSYSNNPHKNKIFIDIGAHIGSWSLHMAKLQPSVHVYAFECNPKIYPLLHANALLQGVSDKITILTSPLSDESKSVVYYDRGADGGSNGLSFLGYERDISSQVTEMRSQTLDSFNLNNIGLIKIDVEGHELEVFKGAYQTIVRNNYPPIIFESWKPSRNDSKNGEAPIPSVELRKKLFEYVKSIGYDILHLIWGEIFLAVRSQ